MVLRINLSKMGSKLLDQPADHLGAAQCSAPQEPNTKQKKH